MWQRWCHVHTLISCPVQWLQESWSSWHGGYQVTMVDVGCVFSVAIIIIIVGKSVAAACRAKMTSDLASLSFRRRELLHCSISSTQSITACLAAWTSSNAMPNTRSLAVQVAQSATLYGGVRQGRCLQCRLSINQLATRPKRLQINELTRVNATSSLPAKHNSSNSPLHLFHCRE